MVSESDVLHALSTVSPPELGGDLVSRQLVRAIKICEGNVAFDLLVPPPLQQARPGIERACRDVLSRVEGVKAVNIRNPAPTSERGAGMPVPGRELVPGIRHVIAVASGKGGVGKSTVATNLAVALALDGARVGLLDADIYGPSIPIMMGVRRTPSVESGKMLPIDRHGVQLMSLGFLMPDDGTPVVWRGPMVGSAIRQMLSDVNWGTLDYLLVDLPPGTGDAQLTLAQIVPLSGVVIVMTSQDVAVGIASKALAMFQRLGVPILGIVENMSTFACPHCGKETPIFSHGGSQDAATRLGVPFLGSIPLDPAVVVHGDRGEPTVVAAAESAQADSFRAVARQLASEIDRLEATDNSQASADPLGGLAARLRPTGP